MTDESMEKMIRSGAAGRLLSDEEYMTIDAPDEEPDEGEDDADEG